ncbi:tRNA (guanine(10)-N(2))-dimethyltransferase [Candidatus Woesearchaeota archaeon]|nr:tRNA (guanine(10)-N(2))-dimethyltransferase [Candidatus Woesearchaeota archaeon]
MEQTEGEAKIIACQGKISKKMPVFYNPVMKLNRDIAILLLNSIDKEEMQMCDMMAGSGVRGVRFLLELKKGKIKRLDMNDSSPAACEQIKENLGLNNVSAPVSCKDANEFLLNSSGYDYIDVDPFGTPNPFLDSAAKRIARDGILAVTATDTAPLAGTYPKTCFRKYWGRPMRNEIMHEVALRLLIRKVQLIGAQFEKALVPILSYSSDHYYRVFFRCLKGKQKVDELMKEHKYLLYCTKCCQQKVSEHNIGFCCDKKMEYSGPMFVGKLWDKKLLKMMAKNCPDDRRLKWLVGMISSEIDTVGFYDVHAFCKKNGIRKIPRMELILQRLREEKARHSRTHLSEYGIRADMDSTGFSRILSSPE